MEIKKEKFDNIDELEFAILQELPKLRILYSLRGEKEEDENNFLKDIYRGINSDCYVDGAFEVLEKIDNGYICSSDEEDKLFLIRDCAEMNIGDLFIYSGSECKKISKEFLDLEKYKNLFNDLDNWEIEKNYYRRTIFAVAEISVEEITFDVVLEKIEEYKKQIIETRIEKEKEQEKREIIEKKEEDKTETIYKNESKGQFNGYNIFNNTIKSDWGNSFVLDKKVNDIFSFDEIKNISYSNTALNKVEHFLSFRNITYTKNKEGVKLYRVVFSKNGDCKIEGEKIPKQKITFILNRLNDGATEKDIKILVKLNGMKVDFINMEEFGFQRNGSYGTSNIPIKNKAISDKLFNVKFIDKSKNFDWEKIKDMFFWSGSRNVKSRCGEKGLLLICNEMGIEKKDLFEILRRLKMLKQLENENGS